MLLNRTYNIGYGEPPSTAFFLLLDTLDELNTDSVIETEDDEQIELE